MTSADKPSTTSSRKPKDTVLPHDSKKKSIPVWIINERQKEADLASLNHRHRTWLKANGWQGRHGQIAILPDQNGAIEGAVLCLGLPEAIDQSALVFGALPLKLPIGTYHIETGLDDPETAALGWVLGSYNYDPYKTPAKKDGPVLKLPRGVNMKRILNIAESMFLGRDLINTPANDMGPNEMELAARKVASQHKATVNVIKGPKLLKANMRLIHAVGRASDREPRLIDMSWGPKKAAKVTLVGKGIVFDTGGLNLKPGNSMALMKKDMGGASAALTLGRMIMAEKLNIRLRILLPVAENAISANAFRPGDVITARDGTTVEIGNTDAEGRLVLADALSLADEDLPDTVISLATLTGAARVALGPDLPPFYTDDDEFAEEVSTAGLATADPLWRMPFWQPYNKMLQSSISNINHISNGPFAGSITAALFLKNFVKNATRYAHFDIYGWTPVSKPGKPKGGEPQAARALLETLKKRHGVQS